MSETTDGVFQLKSRDEKHGTNSNGIGFMQIRNSGVPVKENQNDEQVSHNQVLKLALVVCCCILNPIWMQIRTDNFIHGALASFHAYDFVLFQVATN